jgi:hypothetical protein
MTVLFELATPLDHRDRAAFVADVVAELDGQAEVDVGLVNRVAARAQRRYLGFACPKYAA